MNNKGLRPITVESLLDGEIDLHIIIDFFELLGDVLVELLSQEVIVELRVDF